MKEEWLFPNAIVPVDVETTAALVAEIHRLIGVVGGMALAQPEQEPVCDKDPQGCWNVRCQLGKKCKNTPPQRKPLTYCQECMRPNPIDGTDCAHGIKENT